MTNDVTEKDNEKSKSYLCEEARPGNRNRCSCPRSSTPARLITVDGCVLKLCCVLSQSLAGVHPGDRRRTTRKQASRYEGKEVG